MVNRISGRKLIPDEPKKGNQLKGFCGRVTCQLQHRGALFARRQRMMVSDTAVAYSDSLGAPLVRGASARAKLERSQPCRPQSNLQIASVLKKQYPC